MIRIQPIIRMNDSAEMLKHVTDQSDITFHVECMKITHFFAFEDIPNFQRELVIFLADVRFCYRVVERFSRW